MLLSSIRTLSVNSYMSHIKCRILVTSSVQRNQKSQTNNEFHSYSKFPSEFQARNKVFSRQSQLIVSTSSILTSKGSGVRHFSQNISADEVLNSLSKLLEGSPVDWFQNFLLWTHSITGFSWWSAIIINTIIIRVFLIMPVSLYQRNTSARLENVHSELSGFVLKLQKESERQVQSGLCSPAIAKKHYYRSLRKELSKLYIRDNCHPLKIYALFAVYFSIAISNTLAIRNLCFMLPYPTPYAQLTQIEMSVGGFGWTKNLNLVDSYYIFPIYLSLLSFATLEMGNLLRKQESQIKIVRSIQKGMIVIYPLLSFIVSSRMPAAVILSWVTSSTFAFLEMILLTLPKNRKFIGIPVTSSDHKKPFDYLFNKFQEKYKFAKKLKDA